MARILYKDFLNDREQYHALEKYWQAQIESIAEIKRQKGQWKPWLARTYADGITPLPMDGNPILDARSTNLNRAIRIIQHNPDEEGVEIGAWVNIERDEFASDLPSQELVIHLLLTDYTINLAKLLLAKWMSPETKPEEMKQFISQVIPS